MIITAASDTRLTWTKLKIQRQRSNSTASYEIWMRMLLGGIESGHCCHSALFTLVIQWLTIGQDCQFCHRFIFHANAVSWFRRVAIACFGFRSMKDYCLQALKYFANKYKKCAMIITKSKYLNWNQPIRVAIIFSRLHNKKLQEGPHVMSGNSGNILPIQV